MPRSLLNGRHCLYPTYTLSAKLIKNNITKSKYCFRFNLTLFRLGGGFSKPPSGKIVITPTPKEL